MVGLAPCTARIAGLIAGLCVASAWGAAAAPTPGTTAPAGAALYTSHCAQCHEGGVPRAPHSLEFPMIGPRQIYQALTVGAMKAQGSSLDDAQKRSLAEFLGGHSMDATNEKALRRCAGPAAEFDTDKPPALNGWGMSIDNRRFAAANIAKLSATDVPRLTVKWAFGFPGATRARSQPTVAGGAIYVGSQDGTVYALDFQTGCVRWTFQADGEVRNSVVVERWTAGDTGATPRVFLGDFAATAYALDARTGKLLWKNRIDPHPRATLTASPHLFENRLYFAVSSTEWSAAANPAYECCTFRGGVAAVAADTGRLLWRSFTIATTPVRTGKVNAAGAALWGPAGAPTWGSPTIDARRRRIYVGTGESYTSPPAPTSDAVVAFDLDSGKLLWHHQASQGDAWTLACYIGGGPNCPVENGPDLDIGAPPILATLSNGNDRILVGSKSGEIFALDPDDGRLSWKRRVGRGGATGGIHWGMSFSNDVLFAPVADALIMPGDAKLPARPGLNAVDARTGNLLWHTPAPDGCNESNKPACDPGFSAATTAIPGVVFAGSLDSHLRAFDSATGKLLWDFDTAREFTTVSGTVARGGSLESAGPIVVDGLVVTNAGYLYGGRIGGNVLLAFGVPAK